VSALGDIGPVKIISESSIGSNLRRIEAVSGNGPIELLRAEQAVLDDLAERLNVPRADVGDGLVKRLEEMAGLRDEVKALQGRLAVAKAGELVDDAVDGVVVARVDGVTRDQLKDLAVALRDRDGVRMVVLGGEADGGGASLVAAVGAEASVEAGALIAEGAKAIRGGGGRGADVAQAGGKDPGGLDEALDLARRAAGIGS
jgi:alanyl-tRNA synthetase